MHKYLFAFLILTASVASADPIGGIQSVKEPAYRMPALADSFHVAAEKETIDWGDSLKTGSQGFMGLLFFEDASLIKIAANSSIQLAVPEEGAGRAINMSFGDLWAKINRTELGMVIKTPSSTASVKGTKFWLLVSPDGDSRLLCQEGLIEFVNNISGTRIYVSSGQMCASNMDGAMEISDIEPEPKEQPQPVPEPKEEPDEGMQPKGGPSGAPAPKPTPSEAGGGLFGLSMNGAVGAASINGETYQYFSLRPDISIGKFGLGLDLSLYYDSEGKLREEDWDEAGDFIDKIYYARYGSPGDSFYIRGGSLSPITLGYGLVMRRYTNAIEWPQVRRIGMQTSVKYDDFTFYGLLNNFREIDQPGLIGGRLTYETDYLPLPVVFGGTVVYDGNQYLGARDEDGDGVPDNWDMFPDQDDYEHIDWLETLDSLTISQLVQSGDLPNIFDKPDRISDLDEEVTEWGVDIGIPLIRSENLNLWAYAQMAQILDYGRGYAVPGLMFNLGPFRAGAEYRIFERQFMGDFFDMSYEVERVVWDEASGDYIPKKKTLEYYPKARGYYAEAGMEFFGLFDILASYQYMSYDGAENLSSVYASGSLNTSFIPKISLAEAYYHQPNAEEAFTTDVDGTVLGYKIGVALGGGLSIIYDHKTIYYNGEPNRIMTIETALVF